MDFLFIELKIIALLTVHDIAEISCKCIGVSATGKERGNVAPRVQEKVISQADVEKVGHFSRAADRFFSDKNGPSPIKNIPFTDLGFEGQLQIAHRSQSFV